MYSKLQIKGNIEVKLAFILAVQMYFRQSVRLIAQLFVMQNKASDNTRQQSERENKNSFGEK